MVKITKIFVSILKNIGYVVLSIEHFLIHLHRFDQNLQHFGQIVYNLIKILKILVKKFEHSVQNISNLVKRLKISFKILNIISSKCHSKSRGYGRIFVEIRKNLCQNLNIIRYSFKCSLNFDQNLINFD